MKGAFSCGHALYTSNDKGSPLPYWPSMHLLYSMTKSAVAIGHLALPSPPLHRKSKSENPLNISCKRNTWFMRTSIWSTHYTMADCSLSALPLHLPFQDSKEPSGPNFQINPTIHRHLHLCLLTPPWCCEFPHGRHMNAPIIGMRAMIGYLDVLQV